MRQLLGLRAARAGVETRQDRVALLDQEGAAARDVEGVVAGLGQVGEQGPHRGGRLEPVLGGDPAPLLLADEGARLDAQQGVVGHGEVLRGEIDVVGGDQGDVVGVGPGHQARLGRGLSRQAMALQLDIEAVAEHRLHLGQHRLAVGGLALGEQGIGGPIRPARQQDQPLGVGGHHLPGHARLAVGGGLEVGGRGQGREVQIALLVLGQEGDGRDARPAFALAFAQPHHRKGAADDRLHAGVLGVARELQGPEQVGPIGEPRRRHLVGGRQLADDVRLDRPFQQRIGRAHPKVDETGGWIGLCHGRLFKRRPSPQTIGASTQATKWAATHTMQTKLATDASDRTSRARRIM